MKKRAEFLAILVSNLSLPWVAEYVLSRNLEAGVYPINADSISIPLFETIAATLIMLLLMMATFLITRFLVRFEKARLIAGIGLNALAAFFSGSTAYYWFMPDYHALAVAYAVVTLLAVYLLATHLIKLAKPAFMRQVSS